MNDEERLTRIFMHAAYTKIGNMAYGAHVQSEFGDNEDIHHTKNSTKQYMDGAKEDLTKYVLGTLQEAAQHGGKLTIYVQDDEIKANIDSAIEAIKSEQGSEFKDSFGDVSVLTALVHKNMSQTSRKKLATVIKETNARALKL